MVLCLLIGVVIAASMLSSIPQYTGGILQKLLIKDLENYQVANNVYPGNYHVDVSFMESPDDNSQPYFGFNSQISGYFKALGLPIVTRATTVSDGHYAMTEDENGDAPSVTISAMTDMEPHVKLDYGHFPSDRKNGDAYEVMISSNAMHDLGLNAGSTYVLENVMEDGAPGIKVIIAGVFESKSKTDTYWGQGGTVFSNQLFLNDSLFMSSFGGKDNYGITYAQWNAAFDYHKITLANINRVTTALASQQEVLRGSGADMRVPALDILKAYNGRQKQLQTLLWTLEMPVVLMLIFYLFMVAQLIIEEEKNEIAVMKSRGASRPQIFRAYLIESLMMGGAALLLGPLLGLLLSRMLGASSGFLQFVQRTGLPVRLDAASYLYALIAVAIFIVTMLVPAFLASGTSIVVYRQESRRRRKKAVWKKYFLDVLLLAVACYGIYSYHLRKKIMSFNVAGANDLPVDPLLLLVSTLFILGAGLVFIRIFPLLIQLIFRIGKKHWRPSAYASLLYVSRSGGMEQFLILFLIFTISVGIFNATAARTINTNTEEKIRYSVGADVAITPSWQTQEQDSGDSNVTAGSSGAQYIEPDFSQFQNLSGVSLATKVFKTSGAVVSLQAKNGQQNLINSSGKTGNSFKNTPVTYMGIIPGEFGQVSWFRPDLLPYHWFNYLNLLTKAPQGLLLSRAFEKDFGVKLGDSITVDFGSSGSLFGIAYAFVDYWPTCNPNDVVYGAKQPYFIVGNLNYFQSEMPLMPYQVWIKMQKGATSKQLYSDIQKKDISVSALSDASQEIIESRNDPILEGINGALTLSFLMTMIVTAAGFLIYWIMSIRSRILQFGILRAMGLAYRELIKMLALEQVLISLLSILVGVVVGYGTSRIFVPMLQMAFNTADQVPPFEVAANLGDYLKIFAVMAVILIGGIAALSVLIRKIKMDQALKLGED